MSIHKFRSLALTPRPWLRYFFVELARELKSRFNVKIHLFVSRPGEAKFYAEYLERGIIDSITDSDYPYDSEEVLSASPDAVVRKALHYERKLGRRLNSIASSEKILGAPFALGAYNFPKSNIYSNTNFTTFLCTMVWILDFWDRELREKKIDLVLNGTTELAAIARLNNIPFRHLITSGYENFYQWTCNEYLENPLIEKKYRELEGTIFEHIHIDQPYYSSRKGNQSRLANLPRLSNCIKNCAKTLAGHLYSGLRGQKKGYPLLEDLRYDLNLYRQFKDVLFSHTVKLQDLNKQKFIFFPLAREPEVPYMMMSPEYNSQLAAISSLVRDLPAGWLLAVKEHLSAIGPRTSDFYNQIRYFKQVRLLDVRERGVDCVKAAEAVATIAGSAGIEAAVAGKPVISFGRHNTFNFLPHVMVVKDEADLFKYISRIEENKIDLDKAGRDGARYLNSIIRASFDMKEFDWVNIEDLPKGAVSDAASNLLESLI